MSEKNNPDAGEPADRGVDEEFHPKKDDGFLAPDDSDSDDEAAEEGSGDADAPPVPPPPD